MCDSQDNDICGAPCPKHGTPCLIYRCTPEELEEGKDLASIFGAAFGHADIEHSHFCVECVKENPDGPVWGE